MRLRRQSLASGHLDMMWASSGTRVVFGLRKVFAGAVDDEEGLAWRRVAEGKRKERGDMNEWVW